MVLMCTTLSVKSWGCSGTDNMSAGVSGFIASLLRRQLGIILSFSVRNERKRKLSVMPLRL